MNLYQEEILEHYRNPHNKRHLANPTHMASSVNATCGDALSLELMIEENVITDVGFMGSGCAISQAVMSILTDELVGKRLSDLASYTENDILSIVGITIGPNRRKCVLLSLDVLQKIAYEKS